MTYSGSIEETWNRYTTLCDTWICLVRDDLSIDYPSSREWSSQCAIHHLLTNHYTLLPDTGVNWDNSTIEKSVENIVVHKHS